MELESMFLREQVERFLAEDVGRGDVTTHATIDPSARGAARIEAREGCVIAGLEAAALCFDIASDGAVDWEPVVADGKWAEPMEVIARLHGPVGAILTAERTALNLLQRMSGVATKTQAFVEAVAGTGAKIVDTRKTTPGLRLLEKYAVHVGGAQNHRLGLDDGILIKDNHLAAMGGSIGDAVARARRGNHAGLKIEIEVADVAGLKAAIEAGADIVMLDNFSVEQARAAVKAAAGRVILEASGGITIDNVRAYAETGVDLISVGALTHSARAVDLALELEI
jgi:nicotinate-nucleotide pyrophosphorylase (carboxylating)